VHRSFFSLFDVLPAALFAASIVSFSCRRIARRAAGCMARLSQWSTSISPRRSLRLSFLSLADVLRAVPPATPLVSFSCRRQYDMVQYWILYRKIILVKSEYSNTQ
jgi:hypothetical protein